MLNPQINIDQIENSTVNFLYLRIYPSIKEAVIFFSQFIAFCIDNSQIYFRLDT